MPLRRWEEGKLSQEEGEKGGAALTGLQEVLQGTWVQEMTLSRVTLSLASVHTQSWHLVECTGDPGYRNRQK